MMPLRQFSIEQPKTAAEASEMLAHYGERGRLYAGGTELLLAMKHDLLRYGCLIDVKAVSGLDKIELKNSSLSIGSTATHRAIENASLVQQHFPAIAEMERNVANVRVRSTGTLGGNLCFAEPHSDPATLLLALGAKVRIQGKNSERTAAIEEFLAGPYETSLSPEEILTAVEVPLPVKSQKASYLKFQIHERPTLGLALVVNTDERGERITSARSAVGSVSPKPCRSDKVEDLLVGPRDQVEKQLGEAAEALADEANPVDDFEGSAEYKRHLIGVFLRRAFVKALSS